MSGDSLPRDVHATHPHSGIPKQGFGAAPTPAGNGIRCSTPHPPGPQHDRRAARPTHASSIVEVTALNQRASLERVAAAESTSAVTPARRRHRWSQRLSHHPPKPKPSRHQRLRPCGSEPRILVSGNFGRRSAARGGEDPDTSRAAAAQFAENPLVMGRSGLSVTRGNDRRRDSLCAASSSASLA